MSALKIPGALCGSSVVTVHTRSVARLWRLWYAASSLNRVALLCTCISYTHVCTFKYVNKYIVNWKRKCYRKALWEVLQNYCHERVNISVVDNEGDLWKCNGSSMDTSSYSTSLPHAATWTSKHAISTRKITAVCTRCECIQFPVCSWCNVLSSCDNLGYQRRDRTTNARVLTEGTRIDILQLRVGPQNLILYVHIHVYNKVQIGC